MSETLLTETSFASSTSADLLRSNAVFTVVSKTGSPGCRKGGSAINSSRDAIRS